MLGDKFRPLEGSSLSGRPIDPDEVIGFFRPYDTIYFFTSWRYWSRDVDFESHRRAHERGFLAGWHNMQLLAVRLLE